jgi:hypothetical protein
MALKFHRMKIPGFSANGTVLSYTFIRFEHDRKVLIRVMESVVK